MFGGLSDDSGTRRALISCIIAGMVVNPSATAPSYHIMSYHIISYQVMS